MTAVGRLRARRVGSRIVALTLAVVALASCSGSGYTYVSSRSTGTFFKVPDSWKVFDKDQSLRAKGALAGIVAADDRFAVRVDADPQPSLRHDFITAKYPMVLARVRKLSDAEQDEYSFASLRNELVPIDQITAADQSAVQLLAPPKQLLHDGLRGTDLEFTIKVSKGRTFTAEQVGLVDAGTKSVWYLFIGCRTTCYQRNKALIHRVVDSWTVEGK